MVGVSLRKISQVPTKKIERNIRDVQLLAMSQQYPKKQGGACKSHHLQEVYVIGSVQNTLFIDSGIRLWFFTPTPDALL
jgi:hypothetical protein